MQRDLHNRVLRHSPLAQSEFAKFFGALFFLGSRRIVGQKQESAGVGFEYLDAIFMVADL